jgi:peptidoglycan/xylan/chitin deacetylase (PgdA/CDA1 family)
MPTANIRPDRIATLYFVRPFRQLVRPEVTGLPILMYHSISADSEAGRSAYYRTCTAPAVFAEQMAFLARNGYRTIGMSEAIRRIDGATQNTEKSVVLTFDDGYGDFYTDAFPVLSRFGYTATVFLPTAYIGETAQRFNGSMCLAWNQVRELQKAGIEFGSHTVTHPQLRTVGPKQLRDELGQSKSKIENELGCDVESFSYPYAFPETDRFFVRELRELLGEVGYKNGVSTIIGTAGQTDDRLFLKRLPANSDDDLPLFRAKLDGAYDWLHAFQYASKLMARRDAVPATSRIA